MSDIPRRVTIQHEIANRMSNIDNGRYDGKLRSEIVSDLAADVAWDADCDREALRETLVDLAAMCQSWLEALAAEEAK